jgi:hypothetical protein
VGYVALGCRCLAGLVFALSAFSKLRSRPAFRAFAAWLASLPVLPARARRVAAPAMAVTEVTIVVLLALPWTVLAGLLLAAAALAVFAAGTFVAVRRGTREPCQCFGASTSPLGLRHAARDVLVCAAAAVGAVVTADGAGARAAHPVGIALGLIAGSAAALFVLFLDDVAALFADASDTGQGLASDEGR